MRASSRSTPLADKLAFLKQVPLCAHLADQELIAFSQDLRLREYAKGQIVFEQGDPGDTQFFVSLEDSLMRVFARDMLSGLMGRFGIPEDEPIEHRLVSRRLRRRKPKSRDLTLMRVSMFWNMTMFWTDSARACMRCAAACW